MDNGAVGIITYDGNVNYSDRDIDDRELRPCVNINAKDAVKIIKSNAKDARIELKQKEYKGCSRNVIADLLGKSEKTIVFTAHYDSPSLSRGGIRQHVLCYC